MIIIKRLYSAFFYSWNGLKYAYRTQWAFRFELIMIAFAIPSACYIANTAIDFILLMSSVTLLPILELLNTAIETTINRISFEHHELSGLAKDLGSSALFFAGGQALMVWGVLIVSRLINY